MKIYTILPVRKTETDHYIIDDPNKPAHKEVIYHNYPIYIIEETPQGAILHDYEEDGRKGWTDIYINIEEAKRVVEDAFGSPNISWREIPEECKDPFAYVLDQKKMLKIS